MKRLALILIVSIASFCEAGDEVYGDLLAEVVRIIDGDTIVVNLVGESYGSLRILYPSIISKEIPVRLFGIDTPEIRTKDKIEKAKGESAKHFLEYLLLGNEQVILKQVRRGKFFRIVAVVETNGGINLNKALLESGHAEKYME